MPTILSPVVRRRDYELEVASESVDGHVSEPVVRALLVGARGSEEGTLGGALKTMFGRSRHEFGLLAQNVLVLTPTSIRLFACAGRKWPPTVRHEAGVRSGNGLVTITFSSGATPVTVQPNLTG